jgi:hypothetical protein
LILRRKFSSPASASFPVSIKASVVPCIADKTTAQEFSATALMTIFTTFPMLSALPTDEPPNFKTFIALFIEVMREIS